ncbi:Exopolyphosphatase [Maublancomyces gigas]|uniref:Exopolyphosphatase n=1 Tax=Discina gigas TaxID=1032678 RepID=A0ABR3GVW7_9PEZI
MSIIRTSLGQFLHSSRQSLLSSLGASKPVNIVIGNQSADIDSFASSIIYAYYSPDPSPVPFLSIPRADLALRPEILHLCSLFSISPSDLLFTDDPPIASLPVSGTTLTIVDHNRLESDIRSHFPDDSTVRAVIDHHDDEGFYLSASPRIIEKSGSCTSLIANHFKSSFPTEGPVRGDLARLTLAAVLIDTTNMTNKVTQHDERALKFLEVQIQKSASEDGGDAPEKWDRKAFFDGVWGAKNNVDKLPLRDLLRKDWKEWVEIVDETGEEQKVGIASIPRELNWLKERERGDGFIDGVKAWAEERELDVACIMTTTGRGGEFRRELLVWELTNRANGCISAFTEKAKEAGLGLGEWQNGSLDVGSERRAWTQADLTASRKQVAPLLRESVRAGVGKNLSQV